HSLELRVPFLDRQVFSLARRLPACCKADAWQTKIALRRAAARVLPPLVADRKKLGFPVPVRDWLRREPYYTRVREAFESETAARFFQTKELRKMLEQHRRGRRDNWRQIWCILCFLIWYDEFFGPDGRGAARP
ncbi:MAG: asparagine synthase-related protein, partial [Gemmiger sp.]